MTRPLMPWAVRLFPSLWLKALSFNTSNQVAVLSRDYYRVDEKCAELDCRQGKKVSATGCAARWISRTAW